VQFVGNGKKPYTERLKSETGEKRRKRERERERERERGSESD
jgi:hypothetical protein